MGWSWDETLNELTGAVLFLVLLFLVILGLIPPRKSGGGSRLP